MGLELIGRGSVLQELALLTVDIVAGRLFRKETDANRCADSVANRMWHYIGRGSCAISGSRESGLCSIRRKKMPDRKCTNDRVDSRIPRSSITITEGEGVLYLEMNSMLVMRFSFRTILLFAIARFLQDLLNSLVCSSSTECERSLEVDDDTNRI